MKVNQELILKCLSELRKNQAKYKVYDRYYKGDHDILHNYSMQDARSNEKIIVNYFKKFINDEISYAVGNPIAYVSIKDDDEMLDLIDMNFSHWSKVHDQELVKQGNIFGESYEVNYINQDGEFKATVYNPLQMFVLESGNAEKEVVLAIHTYKENIFSDNEMMDVYYDNIIEHYEVVDDETIIKKGTPNTTIFNKPAITVYTANAERISMLDDIKTLIDSFEIAISNTLNESSDFRSAMLKLSGTTIEDEDLTRMREMGVIEVPEGGDVSYIIKNINDTYTQNLLRELEEKIYKMASHVDTNEKMQSNLSGNAIRSRMISLEGKCTLMQSMLEITVKNRLKNFFEYIKVKTGKEFDYRTVKLKLTMNVPSDLNAIADTISKLRGLTSDETLISWLPIENPTLELAKRKAEQDSQTIDLDKFIDDIADENGLNDEVGE